MSKFFIFFAKSVDKLVCIYYNVIKIRVATNAEKEKNYEYFNNFIKKRPIQEKDLCEILQNGADANDYEIGNANTRFTIEFRKNGQTHKFYIVELADYDEETEEYNTIGYLVELE